jgi:hypothetical protein
MARLPQSSLAVFLERAAVNLEPQHDDPGGEISWHCEIPEGSESKAGCFDFPPHATRKLP